MFFAGAVCALLSYGVVGEVSELSEKQLEGYVAKCEIERVRSIPIARDHLSRCRAELSKKGSTNAMREYHKAREVLIQLETNTPPCWYTLPLSQPSVGQIGLLQYPQAEVFQSLGDDEMLARMNWNYGEKSLFFIKDKSAKNAINGTTIKLNGDVVWAITGTKTYTTANGGTNTVPVLERVDMERLEKLVKPVYRTWASRDGSFECEAMLVAVEKYKVTIERKEDGKQVEVFVRELSKSDRDYVEIFQ